MERNEDTLSTRDLASPSRDATATPDDVRNGQTGGQRRVTQTSGEAPIAQACGDTPTAHPSRSAAPLLPAGLAATFQDRWEEVQTRFIDEPRGAVEEADRLVAELMQKLAESFAQERERLEAQWGRGEDISTEDLRVTLQRYRSFFQRLLAT